MSFQCEKCGCQHTGKSVKKWSMILCIHCKENIEAELPYLEAAWKEEMERENNGTTERAI
jgi:hypothetical protein